MDIQETHFMLDIETLGTTANSVITEIAMEPFMYLKDGGFFVSTRMGLDPLNIRLDPMDQIVSGRTVDKSTIEWWKRTNFPKYQGFMSYPLSGIDASYAIANFLLGFRGRPVIWARSPDFDCRLVKSLLEQHNVGPLWRFQDEMDHRTPLRLAGVKHESDGVHDALNDVKDQVKSLFAAFEKLGINVGEKATT
jgi:hypothetical protein